jgi:hypothetical protein
MGENQHFQSDVEEFNSIYKLDNFENENLKIKKIVCGGYDCNFNIFLTGC